MAGQEWRPPGEKWSSESLETVALTPRQPQALLGAPQTSGSWLAHCAVAADLTLRAATMTQAEVNEDRLEVKAGAACTGHQGREHQGTVP